MWEKSRIVTERISAGTNLTERRGSIEVLRKKTLRGYILTPYTSLVCFALVIVLCFRSVFFLFFYAISLVSGVLALACVYVPDYTAADNAWSNPVVYLLLSKFVTTKLVSLWEASPRTLDVLDVDGWRYQFDGIVETNTYDVVRPPTALLPFFLFSASTFACSAQLVVPDKIAGMKNNIYLNHERVVRPAASLTTTLQLTCL